MLGMLTYHFHLLSRPVQPHVNFKETYKGIKFSVLYIILENSVHHTKHKIDAKTLHVKKNYDQVLCLEMMKPPCLSINHIRA